GTSRHRFGDFENAHRARAVVVGAVADGVEARLVHLAQAVEDRTNLAPLGGRGLAERRVGAHRADHAIEGPQRVVIDGRVIEADVIVMRRERYVFAAQRRITAAQDRDDVACGKLDRRVLKADRAVYSTSGRSRRESLRRRAKQYGGRRVRYPYDWHGRRIRARVRDGPPGADARREFRRKVL